MKRLFILSSFPYSTPGVVGGALRSLVFALRLGATLLSGVLIGSPLLEPVLCVPEDVARVPNGTLCLPVLSFGGHDGTLCLPVLSFGGHDLAV